MKHQIAVGVMTAPEIEAVSPGVLTPSKLRDIIREVADNPL